MEWQGGFSPGLVFLQDSKMSVSSMVCVVMRWQDWFSSIDGWNDKTGLSQGECCYEMARWVCLSEEVECQGGIAPGFVLLWDGKMGFPLWTPALNVILHHPWPLCHQEEDGGKADEEDAPPDEDLYEKAEKEFWDIINSEKKKMPDPTQDFEKSDTGKVNILVAMECDGV